jgi:hypothetical protein
LTLDPVLQLRRRTSRHLRPQRHARNRLCRPALERRAGQPLRVLTVEANERLAEPLPPLARLGESLGQTPADEIGRLGSRTRRGARDREKKRRLLVRGKAADLGDHTGGLIGCARVCGIKGVRQQAGQFGRARLLGHAPRLFGAALPHLTPATNARQPAPPDQSGGTPLGEGDSLDHLAAGRQDDSEEGARRAIATTRFVWRC